MKLHIRYFLLGLLSISLFGTSCFNDLDTIPIDEDLATPENTYDEPSAYKQVLAKIYAGLAVSGQQGPDGKGDISGIDEGFGQYIRGLWYHAELPTDEAVIGWNDQTVADFHDLDWTSSDVFTRAFYSRVFYQISLCNEFLRETTAEKLSSRGESEALIQEIQTFRAEVRFMRALSYWHALDHFRSVPFVTEEDGVGAFFPEQISKEDLFTYIESELLDIEDELLAPRTNEYGRADQAAVWMVLAKLYLNAEVYVGENRYTDCITYCNKVIESGFTLDEEYRTLFLADNNLSNEIIFPVASDGLNIRTWGGTTFIINASNGGSMDPLDRGVTEAWGGIRATSQLVNKFPAVVSGTGGGLIIAPQSGEDYGLEAEIYVLGSYVGWDATQAAPLLNINHDGTFSGSYEGYINFPEDNTEFLIALGRSFDDTFGDSDQDGILDAGFNNILVEQAGFYRVQVNLTDNTYSLTRTDWGVIGSATPGGWDSDTDMVYNPEIGAWEVIVELMPGEIKFRANDAWDLDYGDTGADAILEIGGDNITIANEGIYIVQLFLDTPDHTFAVSLETVDNRAMFYTDGQNLEIETIPEFTEGFPSTKFKNIDRNGVSGSSLVHPDTDFPMFRLADAYLMYAEAVVRGGSGGDMGTALNYVNLVRTRAYGNEEGNIEMGELTLGFLIDERARELHWECHRRTDLVRFNLLTTEDYLWDWKGGVQSGRSVDPRFNVFPLPAADVNANPNLQQNPDYL